MEPVVALNMFTSDTAAEQKYMEDWAAKFGVRLVPVQVWAKGGEGALELADAVTNMLDQSSVPLYDPSQGLEASLEAIATKVYGAKEVMLSKEAQRDLAYLKDNGWDTLPVCISKTQYSFSDDPAELGRPEGHILHVRSLLPRIGAGFILALTGDVMTMPGLPKRPAAEKITVDDRRNIHGLF